jgi:hypothetical protein
MKAIGKGFWVCAALLAAVLVSLLPVLATPRVSDDVLNYSFRWLSSADFSRAVMEEIRFWILSAGRVFFLATYMKDTVFQVFETTLAYKIFLVAMNLACAAVFFVYARVVGRSTGVAVAAALALPILVQLRDYHDPVLSFNGLFQLCAALIFAALALHAQFLRTGARPWLYASLAAFVVNLFVYEMAMLALPLVWLQERTLEPRGARRYVGTRLMLVLFAVYFALVVAGRILGAVVFKMAGEAYGLSLDPRLVAETFGKQLVSVVPFLFINLRPRDGNWGVHAYPDPTPWLGSWQFFLAFPAFVALAFFCLRAYFPYERPTAAPSHAGEGSPDPAGWKALAAAAVAMLVLPAAMIAVVARYQGAFALGNGYSPVYLQRFGAALAFALVLVALLRRLPRTGLAIAITALVLGFASAGNLVDNSAVAAKLAQAWDPQHGWGAMLRSTDFREVCAGSKLVAMEQRPWTQDWLLSHAGVQGAKAEALELALKGSAPAVCVARTVRVAGRNAVVFGRVPGPGPARLYLVVPLEREETRAEIALGSQCLEAPLRLPKIAEWGYSGERFALFALEGAHGGPALSLPCEKPGG